MLGEFWTMLHLPYTLMVLSFVIAGAAVSPRLSWPVLGATLIAYMLGLGVGAHLLDQIPGMGSRYIHHWPVWALWAGGILSIGIAVGIGVVGALFFVGPVFLALVAIQGLCAVGYPLAPVFRGLLHRDSVFAISWGSLPFLTSYYVQSGQLTVSSFVIAAVFAAVAVAEIRVSRLSRQLRLQAGHAEAYSAGLGSRTPLPFRFPDLALQGLSAGTGLLALGLLINHLMLGL